MFKHFGRSTNLLEEKFMNENIYWSDEAAEVGNTIKTT